MGCPIRGSAARRLLVLGLAAALGGCALGDRAEAVYLRQHTAATALAEAIMAAEAEDPARVAAFYDAEDDLSTACAPLREASYRRMNGEAMDGALRAAILGSLDTCEARTAAVEAILWRADPQTARYFLDRPDMAAFPTR
jgi:hypothetical protein